MLMQPGRPTLFATKNTNYYFGLPGNPISGIVGFHFLIIPLLQSILGRKNIQYKKGMLTKSYNKNKKLITDIANEYQMDPFIIVTIAGIESNYGVHHSQFSVFNSLYTQIHEMPRRSKWATRELAEFLKYCFDDQLDPQEIGGSYAGAFGFGQFIPSSFTTYSIDYDKNGIREPYSWPDVLGSIANYLRMNGYKAKSNNYDKNGDIWKSIYAYNHADNYVMAVLELTEKIRKRAKTG